MLSISSHKVCEQLVLRVIFMIFNSGNRHDFNSCTSEKCCLRTTQLFGFNIAFLNFNTLIMRKLYNSLTGDAIKETIWGWGMKFTVP
jgi:hypothetical protein